MNKLHRSKDLTTYASLLRQVKFVLIEGQQKIEQEKVRIYWNTGRLIQEHVLHFKERAAETNTIQRCALTSTSPITIV